MYSSANFLSSSVARFIAQARVPLYRNAYALTLGDAMTNGLGVVYWVIAARSYSASDVGLNSAVLETMMFLSGISQLNLTGALIRFIPSAGSATTRLVGYSYLTSVIVAAVVSLVFTFGLSSWLPAIFVGTSPFFIVWFISATLTWCIFNLQDGVLTGLRQTIWVPIEKTAFAVSKIALLIFFAAALPQYGVFLSWTIPAALAIIPVNLLIFRNFIPRHTRATQENQIPIVPARIVQYVAGNYLGALSWLAATTLLPIMITQEAGAEANAYFYLPWIIAYPLELVAMNMATSLTVEGANSFSNLGIYSRRMFAHTLRLMVPLVAILMIAAPYVLMIFGESYAVEGTTLLRLLALSAIPYVANVIYMGVARVHQWIRGVFLVQASFAALALVLSYVLLQSYGINGVGVAWLISQTVVALVLIIFPLRPILQPVFSRQNVDDQLL